MTIANENPNYSNVTKHNNDKHIMADKTTICWNIFSWAGNGRCDGAMSQKQSLQFPTGNEQSNQWWPLMMNTLVWFGSAVASDDNYSAWKITKMHNQQFVLWLPPTSKTFMYQWPQPHGFAQATSYSFQASKPQQRKWVPHHILRGPKNIRFTTRDTAWVLTSHVSYDKCWLTIGDRHHLYVYFVWC